MTPPGLSLSDQARLTAGVGVQSTAAIEARGLLSLSLSNGSSGVNRRLFDDFEVALCAPCGSAQGATWDVELVQAVGRLLGAEARRKGVHVLLGPMLNVPRSPLGGRSFECLSEDPLLSGTVGAAWVRGVQSARVAACPKHFVANDSETGRTRVDCVVDERALREVYLLPFELTARSGAWALMAAYNRVNGIPCTEHGALLRDVLKGEWGWDGVVLSDWRAARHTIRCAEAGLDLEMPGPPRVFGDALADAVAEGRLDEAVVSDKADRLLRLAERVGRLAASAGEPPDAPDGAEGADTLLLRAAAAGFVLLRNDDAMLPLASPRIAVIGPNATDPCLQGGGSARVGVRETLDPLTAIRARFAGVAYERGCTSRGGAWPLQTLDVRAGEAPAGRGLTVEYFAGDGVEPVAREQRATSLMVWLGELPGGLHATGGRIRVTALLRPEYDGLHAFSVRASSDACLLVGSREVVSMAPVPDPSDPLAPLFSDEHAEGEVWLPAGVDVTVAVELSVPAGESHMLEIGCRPAQQPDRVARAVELARQADVVVLVVGTSDDIEAEGRDRTSTALPGEQEALGRQVLAANPSTVVVVNAGAAVDLAWARSAPAVLYAWLPGQAFGPALAAVLAGDLEPGGRLPVSLAASSGDYAAYDTAPDDDDRLHYDESIFVGYRHLDARGLQPEFCFGHGLGYTEFAYEALSVSRRVDDVDDVEARVTVRNVGKRAGKEIVQVYVAAPDCPVARPPLELKAFAAVTLAPAEARTVSLRLGPRAFCHWDAARGGWRANPGRVEVHVGRSSRDIRLTQLVAQ